MTFNDKGHFDLYLKARKENKESSSAAKKFIANALDINKSQITFERSKNFQKRLIAIQDDAFKTQIMERNVNEGKEKVEFKVDFSKEANE